MIYYKVIIKYLLDESCNCISIVNGTGKCKQVYTFSTNKSHTMAWLGRIVRNTLK